MEEEIKFLEELGDFIYKELSPRDAIKVRKLLFKRINKLKKELKETELDYELKIFRGEKKELRE